MKFAWPLAAAAASVFIVLIAWTVMAMGLPSAERLGLSEIVDGIEVPVIGTVGDFPEPGHRIVVNVAADGRIVVDGVTYSVEQFLSELKRRADSNRGDPLPGVEPPRYLSNAAIVLRADGRLPWGCAQQFVVFCAESSVSKISFAVHREPGGAEGSLGVPLPRHSPDCGHDPNEIDWHDVELSATPEGTAASAVHSALAAAPGTGKPVGVHLHVDPDLSTTIALQAIDAAVRAGAARMDVLLEPVRWPRMKTGSDFDTALRRSRAASAGCAVRIDGKAFVASVQAMPAAPHIRGEAVVPGLSFGEARPDEPAPPARDATPK